MCIERQDKIHYWLIYARKQEELFINTRVKQFHEELFINKRQKCL